MLLPPRVILYEPEWKWTHHPVCDTDRMAMAGFGNLKSLVKA
jgi:hypothetical protein